MPGLLSPTGGLGHAAACIVALSQRPDTSFRCTHLRVRPPCPPANCTTSRELGRRHARRHSDLRYRDVPAAASHGTAGVLGGCQGSGGFGRRAAEDPLSSGWAGEAVRPPCCVVCGLWRSARGSLVGGGSESWWLDVHWPAGALFCWGRWVCREGGAVRVGQDVSPR